MFHRVLSFKHPKDIFQQDFIKTVLKGVNSETIKVVPLPEGFSRQIKD